MIDNRKKLLVALQQIQKQVNSPELDTYVYNDLRQDNGVMLNQLDNAIKVLKDSVDSGESIERFIERVQLSKDSLLEYKDKVNVDNFCENLASPGYCPPVLGGSKEVRDEIMTNHFTKWRILKGVVGVGTFVVLYALAAVFTGGISVALSVLATLFMTGFLYKSRHVVTRIPILGKPIEWFDGWLKRNKTINNVLHGISTFFTYGIPLITGATAAIYVGGKDLNLDIKEGNYFGALLDYMAIRSAFDIAGIGIIAGVGAALPIGIPLDTTGFKGLQKTRISFPNEEPSINLSGSASTVKKYFSKQSDNIEQCFEQVRKIKETPEVEQRLLGDLIRRLEKLVYERDTFYGNMQYEQQITEANLAFNNRTNNYREILYSIKASNSFEPLRGISLGSGRIESRFYNNQPGMSFRM